jgi:hypothetical protein
MATEPATPPRVFRHGSVFLWALDESSVKDGKGCVEVNKGDVVEFERLLTIPSVVCLRLTGQSQCFWTSSFAISQQPQKR